MSVKQKISFSIFISWFNNVYPLNSIVLHKWLKLKHVIDAFMCKSYCSLHACQARCTVTRHEKRKNADQLRQRGEDHDFNKLKFWKKNDIYQFATFLFFFFFFFFCLDIWALKWIKSLKKKNPWFMNHKWNDRACRGFPYWHHLLWQCDRWSLGDGAVSFSSSYCRINNCIFTDKIFLSIWHLPRLLSFTNYPLKAQIFYKGPKFSVILDSWESITSNIMTY